MQAAWPSNGEARISAAIRRATTASIAAYSTCSRVRAGAFQSLVCNVLSRSIFKYARAAAAERKQRVRRASGQPRLQRAMKLAQGDASRLEESQFEGNVVGDDVDAVDQLEDAGAGPAQIDNQDMIATSVGLQQQADVGAVGIEARQLGASGFRR